MCEHDALSSSGVLVAWHEQSKGPESHAEATHMHMPCSLADCDLPCPFPFTLQLVGWGVVAVGMREREPVAAALAFLTHVIGVADKLAAAGTAGTGAAEDAAAASAQRAR